MSILQRLYDSEINAVVLGLRVPRLPGDELNDYRAEGQCGRWEEVERWLDEQARIHYPDSDYARTYAPRVRRPADCPLPQHYLCLFVWCTALRATTQGAADLQAVIDAGQGRLPAEGCGSSAARDAAAGSPMRW